jgi:ribosomal protein S18 acetylase RimI-like enzyme
VKRLEADTTALKVVPLQLEAVIRPATADDVPKLEWFGQYWRYRSIFQRTYEDHLRGTRLMLVADVNDFPVGQAFVQFNSVERRFADGLKRAYIYSLRVMQPFRGRGLGTQLIYVAEQAILARGYGWATIAVAKDNQAALRLYERLGYRTFDDDPGRWSYSDPAGRRHFVNEPSWIMHKQLV